MRLIINAQTTYEDAPRCWKTNFIFHAIFPEPPGSVLRRNGVFLFSPTGTDPCQTVTYIPTTRQWQLRKLRIKTYPNFDVDDDDGVRIRFLMEIVFKK